MAFYYKPADGGVPSGMPLIADGQGYYVRSSVGAIPPPSHVVGPSLAPSVVFPHHSTPPSYHQPVMAPVSLAPYPVGIRPTLVAPSTLNYQPVGLAPSAPQLSQLVPWPYVGGHVAVAPQQGIPFVMGGAPSSSGLYSMPSYNISPSGVIHYPAISSPYCSAAPVSSSYPTPLNATRLPLHRGSVIAIGRAPTAVNSSVPRANYWP